MVRWIVQRWRPIRVEDSMPLRAMRWATPRLRAAIDVVILLGVQLGRLGVGQVVRGSVGSR